MTKQQFIQQEYKEYWEVVKYYITINGWVNTKKWLGDGGNTEVYKKLIGLSLECMDNYSPFYCYWFRPNSLIGIETNNGWIKVESETDLPVDASVTYDVYTTGNLQSEDITLNYVKQLFHQHKILTHYTVHIKRNPPLF